MKIGTREAVGALLLLLTASLCWGFRDNQPQAYKAIHKVVEKGDLKEAKDNEGETPLYEATANDRKDMAKLLIPQEPSGGPEKFAEKIPENLKAMADAAFNEGYNYFIWYPKEGPFISEGGFGIEEIGLSYAINPAMKAEPFATRMKIIAVDTNKKVQEITGNALGERKSGWRAYGMLFQAVWRLEGKGQVFMFLIKTSEIESKNAKPISNTVVVDVVLEKK